ncbi:MAG: ASPIC/UnbV domain-containing protein, partial [Bacteroidia bacterium]
SAFTDITAGSGWDTNTSTSTDNIAYDFDNDGKVDVLGGGNKIMFNQGNNVFAPVTYTGLAVSAVGDLNDDGFIDFQSGTTIRYAVPNGNNWVKFNLQGIQSNRNGIGARVEIYGSWGKQIRDIRSGEGFRHMSTLNAHFGLGTATSIDQVVVIWPSGVVDVINNPNINQALTVIEGSSPLSLVDNNNTKIILYPNPTSDIITLSNIEMLDIKNVSIISTLGKVVKTVNLSNSSFSVSDVSEGLYILLIETSDGKKYSESFIKKN